MMQKHIHIFGDNQKYECICGYTCSECGAHVCGATHPTANITCMLQRKHPEEDHYNTYVPEVGRWKGPEVYCNMYGA